MQAADVMTRNVASVTPSATVGDIVRLLIERRISAVPVVDEAGKLIGMVSEADLLHRPEAGTEVRRPWWVDLFSSPDQRAEAFLKAHGRTAEEVMSRNVEIVQEDTPLDVVAKLMQERHVKRLPVLRDGKVVGIVARADLIRILATALPAQDTSLVDDMTIKDRFERTAREAGFASVGAVTTVVEDGVVHLWGIAETKAELKALELAAAEIPGVRGVESHLAIRSAALGGV
ncbi:MAG: CBS domain-containing protein [Pseudomonadota bacterium]